MKLILTVIILSLSSVNLWANCGVPRTQERNSEHLDETKLKALDIYQSGLFQDALYPTTCVIHFNVEKGIDESLATIRKANVDGIVRIHKAMVDTAHLAEVAKTMKRRAKQWGVDIAINQGLEKQLTKADRETILLALTFKAISASNVKESDVTAFASPHLTEPEKRDREAEDDIGLEHSRRLRDR